MKRNAVLILQCYLRPLPLYKILRVQSRIHSLFRKPAKLLKAQIIFRNLTTAKPTRIVALIQSQEAPLISEIIMNHRHASKLLIKIITSFWMHNKILTRKEPKGFNANSFLKLRRSSNKQERRLSRVSTAHTQSNSAPFTLTAPLRPVWKFDYFHNLTSFFQVPLSSTRTPSLSKIFPSPFFLPFRNYPS